MPSRPFDRIAALRGFRADLAAFALGFLAATVLPPMYAVPVLLISVPGLLTLIDSARNWRVALRRGWWFGFGHHLLGLYWVTEAILYEAARYWWFVPLALAVPSPSDVTRRLVRPMRRISHCAMAEARCRG